MEGITVKFKHKLSEEEKLAVIQGFLPAVDSILTIIPNASYYAVFEDERDGEMEVYRLLVAWAYLKNGDCLPLVYDDFFHTLRNPEKLINFIRIDDGDDPDEDEEEGGVLDGCE